MKKILLILLLIVLLLGVAYAVWANQGTRPINTDNVRQLSGNGWMENVAGEWQTFVLTPAFQNKKIKTVSIIPLSNDEDDYLTSALQKAFASRGVELVTRDPSELHVLQAEIDDWDDEINLKVNPRTAQKLGKGLGCDAFLIGKVFEWDTNLGGIHARTRGVVSLVDTETGGIPWSTGPVMAESYIHWTDFLTHFWEYPALLTILAVIILLLIFCLLGVIWKGFRRTMKAM